jgi:ABC-type dipeptide transport system, periplasmic component
VKWHDGQPFTAKDVKFTHDLILNPKFGAYTKIGHDVVSSVEILDEYTLRVRLKESFSPFLTSWGDTYIVPAHILEGVADPNTAEFNTKSPVGTGPFKFASRVAGDHLVLRANESYHGQPPALERVIFKYIPDLTVLYTQFKTGAVDVTGMQGISAEFFGEAKALPGITLHQHATPSVEYIYFNHGKPQFKEVAVRQALYAAVDKKAIIDQIYYGIHKPVEGYLPATSWAYNADLPKQEYNPEKAKQILEESGWKVGATGFAPRTACVSPSPTPPPRATSSASRRRPWSSRIGRPSAWTCRSTTCRRPWCGASTTSSPSTTPCSWASRPSSVTIRTA